MSIDDKKLWLSCILEEYKYICTESISAMTKQQSTIQYGLTVIGVSLGLAFNTDNDTARFLTFATLVPFLSSLFFLFYANEFARMVRAGRYIVYIEQKINSSMPDKLQALEWEQWLEKKVDGKTPRLPFYFAAPGIFFATSIFSSIMAYLYQCGGPFSVFLNKLILFIVGVFATGVIVVVSIKLINLRKGYSRYFGSIAHNKTHSADGMGVRGNP